MNGLQNLKFEKKNSLYGKYFEKLYMGEFWNCSSISPNTILYIKAELHVQVLEASEFRPLDPSSFVLLYSIKRRGPSIMTPKGSLNFLLIQIPHGIEGEVTSILKCILSYLD